MSGREPFFDNAKFLAILLVVAGHAIGGLRDVPAARAAYVFVYLFHMPLFIVLTGYLSRGFTLSGGKARKLITHLAAPYVIFEVLYSVYFSLMEHKTLDISLSRPTFVMWFLPAVFIWRLSTPVWQQIRWPLAFAVAICLLSYTTALSRDLGLHRVLGLAPFYVLGLMLRPEHFELLRTPRARLVGIFVLVCGAGLAAVVAGHVPHQWVYWNSGHAVMGVSNLTGTLVRAGMLFGAVSLVAAFLTIVPTRRTWFTSLGAATLYAYLLHDFVIRTVLIYLGVYELDALHSVAGVAFVATAASVLATLLCTAPVVRGTRFLVQPSMTWAWASNLRAGDSRR